MSRRPYHHELLRPHASSAEQFHDLAADLRELDYTTTAVEELLGPMATAALDREQAEPARLRLDNLLHDVGRPTSQRALAAVVSCWMLGDPVPTELLAAALPRTGVNGAWGMDLGWVRRDQFHPVVDLSPYSSDDLDDVWVVSDQTALQTRSPLPTWHVLGVGRASLTLAGTVDRRPVQRALDLGTGCGIQTLHLLRHAEHVTATDLSTRALDFAAFTLGLNAESLGLELSPAGELPADRVTLLAGDLLEPVAGQQFDLVVSNPPFVITPRQEHHEGSEAATGTGADGINTYRDGGRTGDRLLAELVTRLPEHLSPGGTVQMLGNWEIHGAYASETDTGPDAAQDTDTAPDTDTAVAGSASPQLPHWDRRPRSWVPEGTDAWFVQRDLLDPAGYAETWLQDSSEQLEPEYFAAGYRSYLEDFATRGVAAVGFGYLWLRRPESERVGRVRAETVEGELQSPLGPAWAAAIARGDLITAADGTPDLEALRELHVAVPSDVTEERHQRFGAADPEVILARQGAGFRRVARLDTATAGFLAAADGEFTIGQLAGAVAGLLELDASAERALLLAVAELVRDGFLVPQDAVCDTDHA